MDLNSKLVEKIKSVDNAITDELLTRSAAPLNTHCLRLNSMAGRYSKAARFLGVIVGPGYLLVSGCKWFSFVKHKTLGEFTDTY